MYVRLRQQHFFKLNRDISTRILYVLVSCRDEMKKMLIPNSKWGNVSFEIWNFYYLSLLLLLGGFMSPMTNKFAFCLLSRGFIPHLISSYDKMERCWRRRISNVFLNWLDIIAKWQWWLFLWAGFSNRLSKLQRFVFNCE